VQERGVTVDRQAFFDDADAALDLSRRARPRYREVSLDSEPRRAKVDEPQDEKGRPIVALPDRSTDCDAELAGKSPDEIVEILEARTDDRDANNVERLMQQFPGQTDGARRSSSSSGKKRRKPRPPVDHTRRASATFRTLARTARTRLPAASVRRHSRGSASTQAATSTLA
jgi:hypothetical protein